VSLGLYISVPFCRTKCSYCNFASGVVSRAVFARYVERVCADLAGAGQLAEEMGGRLERDVDSIYLGGGTPTVLEPADLEHIFATARREFRVRPEAEITVEIAPGSLPPETLDALLRCGLNRASLGVQSFVDQEAASVGRLHTRAVVADDIARLRAAGVANISLDLIAGLPHQTAQSWRQSLAEAVSAGVPHVSVYMLEVDEDSRLGRELIAGGTRYHAHFVPDDDITASFYLEACERLEAAGVRQYEISNFARPGRESGHNLKYWTRQPYLGFGVDAHSMLPAGSRPQRAAAEQEISEYLEHAPNFGGYCPSQDADFYQRLGVESVRFSTPDSLEAYLAGEPGQRTAVSFPQALEETYFLGLRLNRGLQPQELAERFGPEATTVFRDQLAELRGLGLVEVQDGITRLTPRGRLLSNEVFERFLGAAGAVGTGL
jgi:oxygen-independent coproporphyrinogen-3 oxidase